MERLFVFLFCVMVFLSGCAKQETLDWHIHDRSRFLKENRSACRILKVDDEGCERKVEIEGLITKESTWATFDKRMEPKTGEIWHLTPVTDGKVAWFRLSLMRPSLED